MSEGESGTAAAQVLATPLKRLERQLRTYKLLGFAALVSAMAALGLSGLMLSNQRLEARSFVLKGGNDVVLAELGISRDGAPGLYFYDQDSKTRVWLGVVTDGSPRLVFGDATGKPRASLVLANEYQDQARFHLYDAQGETRATLGLTANGAPALEFANDQGKPVFRVPPAAGARPEQRWVNYNAAGTRALIQGRLEDAEKLYAAAFREAKSFGPQDLRLAASLNNLGVLYVKQQKFGEAGKAYQGALAIRESALGNDHPQVAQTLANMAYLQQAQGQTKEAERLYMKAVAMTEKALGPDTPSLISPLTNYAELLRMLDRGEEANRLELRIKALEEKQAAKIKTS